MDRLRNLLVALFVAAIILRIIIALLAPVLPSLDALLVLLTGLVIFIRRR